VFVQQWAGEAAAVADSIDTDLFTLTICPALDFVATVNRECESGYRDCRILLCNGAATFDPGAVAALDAVLDHVPDLAMVSPYLDGQPYAGPVNPCGVMVREHVMADIRIDRRVRCFAWERMLEHALVKHPWYMGPRGRGHAARAGMTSLSDPERMVARGTHYYDELNDNEMAERIIGGKA
jgi:hypothetical protein